MKTSNIRITSSDIKDGLSLRVRPGSAAPCPSLSLTKSPPEHEGWRGGVEKNSLSFMSLDTVWINAKTQPIMNWNPVEIEGQSCLFFFVSSAEKNKWSGRRSLWSFTAAFNYLAVKKNNGAGKLQKLQSCQTADQGTKVHICGGFKSKHWNSQNSTFSKTVSYLRC